MCVGMAYVHDMSEILRSGRIGHGNRLQVVQPVPKSGDSVGIVRFHDLHNILYGSISCISRGLVIDVLVDLYLFLIVRTFLYLFRYEDWGFVVPVRQSILSRLNVMMHSTYLCHVFGLWYWSFLLLCGPVHLLL